MQTIFQSVLIRIISGYQFFFSPWTQGACRFMPSCSAYAKLAIQKHGACKGLRLMVCRLIKCHPWSEGGVDEVP